MEHVRADVVGDVYAYSPYGETTTLGPDDGNSIQYTARENDGTGLYFYRARYYDPILKQWISEDTIGLGGGLNQREYVDGDPVSKSDPFGEYGLPGALAGAAISFGGQFVANYLQTGNLGQSLSCINLTSVAVSAAFGALGPTFYANIVKGAAGPYGFSQAQNAFIYGTVTLPVGAGYKLSLPKYTVGILVGSSCSCQGLGLGNLVGSVLGP